MSAKQFKGKWKVTSTEQWDVDPDWYIEFDGKSSGAFKFADFMQASIDYTSGEDDRVDFMFSGNDEQEEIFGRGWAKIYGTNMEGHLYLHEGHLYLHEGDNTGFTAKK